MSPASRVLIERLDAHHESMLCAAGAWRQSHVSSTSFPESKALTSAVSSATSGTEEAVRAVDRGTAAAVAEQALAADLADAVRELSTFHRSPTQLEALRTDEEATRDLRMAGLGGIPPPSPTA